MFPLIILCLWLIGALTSLIGRCIYALFGFVCVHRDSIRSALDIDLALVTRRPFVDADGRADGSIRSQFEFVMLASIRRAFSLSSNRSVRQLVCHYYIPCNTHRHTHTHTHTHLYLHLPLAVTTQNCISAAKRQKSDLVEIDIGNIYNKGFVMFDNLRPWQKPYLVAAVRLLAEYDSSDSLRVMCAFFVRANLDM